MAGLEGTRLGDYELVESIGSGGMAEVYRARQLTAFNREVAVKVIRSGFSQQDEFRARFLREAQAISRLSHPNILPLIEFGEENQNLYLVMPLVREGTLRDLIKQSQGPLALEEALPLFTQLCNAVHYAHTQGFVHRDIKPQNVLLQQHTHVLLADFGIARDRAEKTITATGVGVGSAEYMAPEQAVGQADTRSDIYSLGVVLYQMLIGAVPYSGSTPIQVLLKHTTAPLPDPRTLNPHLALGIVQVLQTALAKNPDERFQSAQALGRAAQADVSGSLPRSSTAGWSQPVIPAPSASSSAAFTPPAPSYTNPITPYEQQSAQPLPVASLGSYETRAVVAGSPGPLATGSMTPVSQPLAGQRSPGFSGPTPQFFPAPSTPGYTAPGMPGTVVKPPAVKRKSGMIALVSAIVLVALLGATLLTLGLTKSGPFAPPGSANHQTTPTSASIPAGFKLFTNSDHSFSIIYPTGWSMKPVLPTSGTGEEFDGPSTQIAQVSNGGPNQSTDTGTSDDAFCLTFGLTTSGHTTVTIDGQRWTREECDSYGGISHGLVETVIYKGHLYLLSYAAPRGTFNDTRNQYFTPMEQSFKFLT